jgi:hypothetical protein
MKWYEKRKFLHKRHYTDEERKNNKRFFELVNRKNLTDKEFFELMKIAMMENFRK